MAKFLDFLAKPENAAEWHQKTGYLPITKAAYDLTREQGFYEKNPGADTATRQMLNKPPLPFTKGLRLGNMPQIRVIVDEELESVWTGKKTPQQALGYRPLSVEISCCAALRNRRSLNQCNVGCVSLI
ncbi:glycerol-3-phosphate ABC transporter, substrate-binding protein [Escherichia coli]|nr:glycerol-3-phosphate ABC transporter, substrate-binding protein [Escherichia coli]